MSGMQARTEAISKTRFTMGLPKIAPPCEKIQLKNQMARPASITWPMRVVGTTFSIHLASSDLLSDFSGITSAMSNCRAPVAYYAITCGLVAGKGRGDEGMGRGGETKTGDSRSLL